MSSVSDTASEAAAVQLDSYRRMGPAARLDVCLQLGEMSRSITSSGVRARHPDYSDEQVRQATLRIWLGPTDFCRAYPDAEELDP